MAKEKSSTKRALIDKANSNMVIATSVAAFVFVFCAIASKSLISQALYQNRVISAQNKAVTQLKTDLNSTQDLTASYKAFVSTPQNIIGGNPNSSQSSNDGDSAKIVLDALPSQYDYPALLTSVEAMLTSQGVSISSISGTDNQLQEQTNSSSTNPSPVAMPFQFSVTGNYNAIQSAVSIFERSIRPIQFQTMQLSGSQSNLTLAVTAQTYYQPAKSLDLTTETIK